MFFFFFSLSLPQIYEEFYHTINNSDHLKDLRWWSNNHGVNMAMNWPAFVVNCSCHILFLYFLLRVINITDKMLNCFYVYNKVTFIY